jgi:hypothetical protein
VSPRPAVQWSWRDVVVLALTCAVALYRFSYTVADPDLWGHVKFGELFVQSGVPREDPYSYLTAGTPWTDHEWLSEALFYLAFAAAGTSGLILGKLAITLFIVGATYVHLRRREATAPQAGAVVLIVLIAMIPGMITVRTQVFTYLLFFLLLLVIASRASGWLWACPVLFLAWANLHPGFIAGLAVLAAWCSVKAGWSLMRRARVPDERPVTLAVGAVFAASFLATALTPFRIELWRFLLHPATFDRPDISEWRAVSVADGYGVAYVAILGVSVAGFLLSRRQRDPALMAVFAAVALAPLTAIRHGPLFGLAVGVLAGEHIADAWSRLRPSVSSPAGSRPDRWILAGAAVVVVLCLAGAARQMSCIRIEPATRAFYPVHATALLRDSGVSGNLAIHFDWGLYAIWHLQPSIKISLDGRRETAYSPAVYAENLRFRHGVGEWDTLVRRPETDMALVSKDFPVFNLMKLTRDWVLAHEDAGSGLFVRGGSPLLAALQQTPLRSLPPGGAGLCFP